MIISKLISEVNSKVMQTIHEMAKIEPRAAGIDDRAAWRIWIHETGIAVRVNHDDDFQKYGGFDKVDRVSRVVLGGYVFYLANERRVRAAIDFWNSSKTR